MSGNSQNDNDLPNCDRQKQIEQYWNRVFQLQSSDGQLRYKLLPTIIKSALILGQTNAESECSLSVNARVVTKERALLGVKTIVVLHVVKEAVRFSDPISNQVEKINITEELKRSVKFAHAAYNEHLEKEREEKQRKREAQKEKELAEKAQRKRERLAKKKQSLAKSEESLNDQEVKARQKLGATNELLKDATSKLNSVLASTPMNINSITGAKMMLETANNKRKATVEKLDEIRRKQKSIDQTTHKLLDQALPSKDSSQKKRKSESKDKSGKKLKE